MKRTTVLLALAAAIAMTIPAFAQDRDMTARRQEIFQKGKQETVQGKVIAVRAFPRHRRFSRIVAIVKTDDGRVPVVLGPWWYLRYNRFRVRPDDKLVVDGSLLNFRHHRVLIAEKVRRDDAVLNLRDNTGKPLWPQRAS